METAKKKLLSILIVLCLSLSFVIPVFAQTHNGTYDMTGGIFYKQSMGPGNIYISVSPSTGTPSCDMIIYTAKKDWLGMWSGDAYIASVSSVMASTTTYYSNSQIDGIYFRNYSGLQWTGSFSVTW